MKSLKCFVFVVLLSTCQLNAEYTIGGLNGLFYLNNARISDVGTFTLAPQIVYEDYDAGSVFRFLINGNYGIYDNSEIGVSLPIIRASNGSSETGIGDISVAGKYLFAAQQEKKPAIGAVVRLDLPTGDKEKGLGGATDFLASAVADYTLGNVDLSAELGVAMCGDIDVSQPESSKAKKLNITHKRKNYLLLGAGASYSYSERLDLLGALFFNGYNGYAGGGHVLNAGVSYAWRKAIRLKGGLLIGLEDPSPDFGLLIGLTGSF